MAFGSASRCVGNRMHYYCSFVGILSWARTVRDVSLFTQFGSILNVYWMTAPMACLYAIPFERFMDPGGATRANLTLLGIVSVWRVTLMIRCVSVLYAASLIAATMPVMVFCLGMGYAALTLIPSPVFMIMGGIRLTESEDIILGVKMMLIACAVVTAPIWIIGYLTCCSAKSPWRWQLREFEGQNQPASKAAWMTAIVALGFLLPFLPWTQHEQWLRWRAEKLLLTGAIDELSQLTREHPEKDLPPHWDPPPRTGYGEIKPDLIPTILNIHASGPATWFWQLYLNKLERYRFPFYFASNRLDDSNLAVFIEIFDELNISPWQAESIDQSIEQSLQDESISQERQDLLKAMQKRCKATSAKSIRIEGTN